MYSNFVIKTQNDNDTNPVCGSRFKIIAKYFGGSLECGGFHCSLCNKHLLVVFVFPEWVLSVQLSF